MKKIKSVYVLGEFLSVVYIDGSKHFICKVEDVTPQEKEFINNGYVTYVSKQGWFKITE